MRSQLFFEGPDLRRRLSRYWLLLPLPALIAAAGVVSDSTATVIGAMIVAPLMTPILGLVLSVVLSDGPNLLALPWPAGGRAIAVVGLGYIVGLFVPSQARREVASCQLWLSVTAVVMPTDVTKGHPSSPTPRSLLGGTLASYRPQSPVNDIPSESHRCSRNAKMTPGTMEIVPPAINRFHISACCVKK
jgi:hypothetical protein